MVWDTLLMIIITTYHNFIFSLFNEGDNIVFSPLRSENE